MITKMDLIKLVEDEVTRERHIWQGRADAMQTELTVARGAAEELNGAETESVFLYVNTYCCDTGKYAYAVHFSTRVKAWAYLGTFDYESGDGPTSWDVITEPEDIVHAADHIWGDGVLGGFFEFFGIDPWAGR